jgi:hypothetical protein
MSKSGTVLEGGDEVRSTLQIRLGDTVRHPHFGLGVVMDETLGGELIICKARFVRSYRSGYSYHGRHIRASEVVEWRRAR